MNPTLQKIVDEIERGYSGDPWHGPSLTRLLSDVDAAIATATPVAGAHSIAQLALHIAAWKEIVAERLSSPVPFDVPPERDWPQAPGAGEWEQALVRLAASERDLVGAIAAFPPDRLLSPVPGKRHTFAVELRGITQHDAYHGGQIAVLKRAARGLTGA
jgi:uncharacterized damage-inducible protein DinB